MDDRENKGFEPRGAGFWKRGQDYVIWEWLVMLNNPMNRLDELR